jgi:WD40 repeat protein
MPTLVRASQRSRQEIPYAPLQRGGSAEAHERPLPSKRASQRWSTPDAHAAAAVELSEHKDRVYSVAFARDGEHFFTADTNGKAVRMWDTHTHKKVRDFTTADHGRIFGCAVSPDGKTLATADYDGAAAHLFDVETGALRLTCRKADKKEGRKGHTQGVWSVAFSPDGTALVSGAWDSKAIVWDVAKGEVLCELEGHEARVMGATYSPDGRIIATASWDGTVRTWEPDTGDPLYTYEVPSADPPGSGLHGVAFAPDGSSMTVAVDSGIATTYSVPHDRTIRGKLVCELKPSRKKQGGVKEKHSKVYGVGYSVDSRTVATAHSDGLVRIWDLALGVEVQIIKVRHRRPPPPPPPPAAAGAAPPAAAFAAECVAGCATTGARSPPQEDRSLPQPLEDGR